MSESYGKEYLIKNRKYAELKIILKNSSYNESLEAIKEYLIDYPNDPYVLLEYAKKIIYEDEEAGLIILNKLKSNNKLSEIAYKVIFFHYIHTQNTKELTNILDEMKNVFDSFKFKYYEIEYNYYLGYRENAKNLTEEQLKFIKKNDDICFNDKYDIILQIIERDNKKAMKKNYDYIFSILNKALNFGNITIDQYYCHIIAVYNACRNYNQLVQVFNKINYDKLKIRNLIYLYKIADSLDLPLKKEIKEKINANKENLNFIHNINELVSFDLINENIDENLKRYKEILKTSNEEDSLKILVKIYKYSIINYRYNEILEIMNSKISQYDNSLKYTEFYINIVDLLIELKKYKEAYKYLNDKKEYFLNYDKKSLAKYELYNEYLSKKLNILNDNNINTYTMNLIKNYDENLVKKHIEIHKYKRSKELRYFCFDENMDTDKLLVDIKNKLSNQNTTKIGLFHEYIIELNGYSSESNKFLVLTFGEENYIYNCYPVDYVDKEEVEEYEEETDNEYIETNKPKVKRLSQIEKFNMRYNNI